MSGLGYEEQYATVEERTAAAAVYAARAAPATGWLASATSAVSNVMGALNKAGITDVASTLVSAMVAKTMAPAVAAAKKAAPAKPGAAVPPPAKKMPGWVLPVAIGAGVLLLGGVAFAAARKRS